MKLELRTFEQIDYQAIADVFMKYLFYKRELKGDDFAIYSAKYAEYSVKMAFPDLDLFFGIYLDDKLVGTIGGSYVQCSFQGELMIGSAINTYTLDPDLLPVERETLKDLFEQLLEKLREKSVDFVWVIVIKENNPLELKIFKEDLLFSKLNKNVESLVKLLGSEGVNILREKREMNVVLAKLASMMAGMDKMDLPGGIIRDATPEDYPKIIELLNNYTKTLPLAQFWTLDSYHQYIDNSAIVNSVDWSELKKEYPDTPFGFHIKVWERNSEIVAVIHYRVSRINFKNGDAPFGFWDYLAFAPSLEFEEKKAFIINLYNELHLKAIIITVFLPYYDFKAFNKSGFMTERRKTPLFILPLTAKGKKLLELEKLKKFYLPTLTDFAI